ncbi:rhomboid family intramembrane serine protease [Natribaculum luteum]|uniref:Rhomboid family intramembrane serine protease n=1 Tax=Natribaculum luteum TaxID=1586232 RepID=A0ABD5NUS3_9EURY|nr:rhomboid family intramembrane serine protease [Natribaculum luteum]
MLSLEWVLGVLVVGTLLASIGTVRLLERSSRRWDDVLRSRLLGGVPWGTIVVIAFVLAVYLFVQDGISDFHDPVTIPYRAWSYLYPLGIATASFSHASSSHLVGNLVGTAVLAPIVEFAWGHYPRDGAESNGSWRTSPWFRAFVVFPLVVVVVGLLTSLFSIGPVIGFSGVVFAFAGFALVRYPVATLVAAIGAQGAVMTVYRALRSPINVYVATPSPPSPPWWASIAIQGHALGFFVGLLLAAVVFSRRGYRPDPLRFWLAVLFFGFSKALWAIYWFRGANSFVLYRGPGVVVVVATTLLVTLAVTASDRPLLPDALVDRLPLLARSTADRTRLERILELGLANDDSLSGSIRTRIRDLARGPRSRTASKLSNVTRRQSALAVVLVVVALISGPAIPVNLFVVDQESTAANASVTVEDYTVRYVEGEENELVGVVDISAFGENTTIESSGVVVSSSSRNIWLEAVSANRLAFERNVTVDVGGPGWRETVHVQREGWSAVGNDSAYQIWLWADGDDRQLAYTSDPVRSEVRIDGKRVTLVPDEGSFSIEVEDDDAVSDVALPAENETVEAGGISFERDGDAIYAASDGTYVQVASEEGRGDY